MDSQLKNYQYKKFCAYGFLKNLRFFDAFLLLFFVETGLSYTQVGLLYALKEIATNFLEFPSGLLADAYGRKRSLLIAFACYILSFLIFYCSADLWLLSLAMLLYGVGDAFRSGTHKGMIMDYLKRNNWQDHKISYYGHTRSWSQKGSAISALVAGVLVFWSGEYRVIFLCAIIPYLLNFINILSYPEVLNFASKEKAPKPLREVWSQAWSAFKDSHVIYLINSSGLHSAYLKSIKDYIQPLMVHLVFLIPLSYNLTDKQGTGVVVGLCFTIIYFLSSLASKSAGRLSDSPIRRLEIKTLNLGLLSGLLCGLLYHWGWHIPALFLFVGIYLIENIRKPILTGYMADKVSNEILTSVISAESFYKTFVTAGIAVLLGRLADTIGIGMGMVIVCILLLLLSTLLSLKKN